MDIFRKLSTGILWKSVVVLLVVVIAVCEAQTFQYSRGWTNGKRSRGMENRYPSGPGPAQPFDIDVGVVEVPIDDVPVPLRINLSPQLRTRSTDYNQVRGGRLVVPVQSEIIISSVRQIKN